MWVCNAVLQLAILMTHWSSVSIASSTAVHVCYANRVLFVDFFCCDVPDFLAVPGTYM